MAAARFLALAIALVATCIACGRPSLLQASLRTTAFVTLPAPAVQQGPHGSFVWVIGPDGTVQTRPVTVAQIDGGQALLDKVYRERAVVNLLRSVPIFSSLFQDNQQFARFIGFLRDRVQLMRLSPGEVIFRQGDPADSFYLVRIGFVKVTESLCITSPVAGCATTADADT